MSRELEAILFRSYREMEPCQKLAVVDDLNRREEERMRALIRERHPVAGEEHVRLWLAALRQGRAFTIEWFGWDPKAEGW